jgi:hypothetical protein
MKLFGYIFILCIMVLPASFSYADIKRVQVPLEGSPSKGPVDAAVTIVEFLDYQ